MTQEFIHKTLIPLVFTACLTIFGMGTKLLNERADHQESLGRVILMLAKECK